MTNPTESPSLPSPFSSLASRLSAWRSAGRPGRRIPEPFWEEATALAKVHGLSPTSTILKLNYYHLQRRLQPTLPASEAPPLPPTFVTLPTPPFSSAGAGADGGTLELVRPGGGRGTKSKSSGKNTSIKELWVVSVNGGALYASERQRLECGDEISKQWRSGSKLQRNDCASCGVSKKRSDPEALCPRT